MAAECALRDTWTLAVELPFFRLKRPNRAGSKVIRWSIQVIRHYPYPDIVGRTLAMTMRREEEIAPLPRSFAMTAWSFGTSHSGLLQRRKGKFLPYRDGR